MVPVCDEVLREYWSSGYCASAAGFFELRGRVLTLRGAMCFTNKEDAKWAQEFFFSNA
jgi:hypothetical protein